MVNPEVVAAIRYLLHRVIDLEDDLKMVEEMLKRVHPDTGPHMETMREKIRNLDSSKALRYAIDHLDLEGLIDALPTKREPIQ